MLPGTVTADMRRAAKVINFGILYGMGPQRLAGELGIPLAEAQRYIASYFERYAGVRRYMNGGRRGGPRDAASRPPSWAAAAPIPELRSPERGVAQAAERVAANTPIQGSAADLIKLAMVRRRAPPGRGAAGRRDGPPGARRAAARGARRATARRPAAAVREEMEGVHAAGGPAAGRPRGRPHLGGGPLNVRQLPEYAPPRAVYGR